MRGNRDANGSIAVHVRIKLQDRRSFFDASPVVVGDHSQGRFLGQPLRRLIQANDCSSQFVQLVTQPFKVRI